MAQVGQEGALNALEVRHEVGEVGQEGALAALVPHERSHAQKRSLVGRPFIDKRR